MATKRLSKVQDKIIETLLCNIGHFSVKELLDLTKVQVSENSFYRSLKNMIVKDILIRRGSGAQQRGNLSMTNDRYYYVNVEKLNVEKWLKFYNDEKVEFIPSFGERVRGFHLQAIKMDQQIALFSRLFHSDEFKERNNKIKESDRANLSNILIEIRDMLRQQSDKVNSFLSELEVDKPEVIEIEYKDNDKKSEVK